MTTSGARVEGEDAESGPSSVATWRPSLDRRRLRIGRRVGVALLAVGAGCCLFAGWFGIREYRNDSWLIGRGERTSAHVVSSQGDYRRVEFMYPPGDKHDVTVLSDDYSSVEIAFDPTSPANAVSLSDPYDEVVGWGVLFGVGAALERGGRSDHPGSTRSGDDGTHDRRSRPTSASGQGHSKAFVRRDARRRIRQQGFSAQSQACPQRCHRRCSTPRPTWRRAVRSSSLLRRRGRLRRARGAGGPHRVVERDRPHRHAHLRRTVASRSYEIPAAFPIASHASTRHSSRWQGPEPVWLDRTQHG